MACRRKEQQNAGLDVSPAFVPRPVLAAHLAESPEIGAVVHTPFTSSAQRSF